MPAGRPSKYKPEFCQMLEDFFDIEPNYEKEVDHYDKVGNVKWRDTQKIPNKLPSLRRFAHSVGVKPFTMYDWTDPNEETYKPEFSQAYARAKKVLLKWFIAENALERVYDAKFALFILKNISDWTDQQQLEVGEGLLSGLLKQISETHAGKEDKGKDEPKPVEAWKKTELKLAPGKE